MRAALAISIVLLSWGAASAQDQPAAEEARGALRFASGAALAFVLHEAGHVVAGISLDARPRLRRIDYGVVPFFAIDHRSVSAVKEFTISSAGFWAQHAGSEWLLTTHPELRRERAPMLKGMLAFNLAASAVYGAAAMGRFGPPERDTRGMAISLGDDGAPEPIVGLLVLGPAVLDGYRYLRPESSWAKWASRGAKIAGVVLVAAAGR